MKVEIIGKLKEYSMVFFLAVCVVVIGEVLLLLFFVERSPKQTDASLSNGRLKLYRNVHDADKKGQLCVSVGAHVSPDRSVNVGLANVARLAAILHLPATSEWAEEVSIATRGHAWLNIYSGEDRIQTVGLWPGGIFFG